MAVFKNFYYIKQGCSDYVKDVRGCVGRAIVEIRMAEVDFFCRLKV